MYTLLLALLLLQQPVEISGQVCSGANGIRGTPVEEFTVFNSAPSALEISGNILGSGPAISLPVDEGKLTIGATVSVFFKTSNGDNVASFRIRDCGSFSNFVFFNSPSFQPSGDFIEVSDTLSQDLTGRTDQCVDLYLNFAGTLYVDDFNVADPDTCAGLLPGGAPTPCVDGEIGASGNCTTCPVGSYCVADINGNGIEYPCPTDSSSSSGSNSLSDCSCDMGFTGPAGGPCVGDGETNEAAGGSWSGMAISGGSIIDNGDGSVTVGCSGDAELEAITYDVDVSDFSLAIDLGLVPVKLFLNIIVNSIGPGDSALVNFLYLNGMGGEEGKAFDPAQEYNSAAPLITLEAAGTLPANTRTIQIQVNVACLMGMKRSEDTNVTVSNPGVILQNAQVNGDPHFVGFEGTRYTFTGTDGDLFSLFSDMGFQVNIKVSKGNVRGVDGTWITELGIKTPDHEIVVDAYRGLVDDSLLAHDADLALKDGHLSFASNDDGTPATLSVSLGAYSLRIIRQTDGTFAYFDLKASLIAMPVKPHGILGQTAQFLLDGKEPTPKRVTGDNGEGFLEGTPADYQVNSLLGTECNLCTYNVDLDVSRSALTNTFEAFSL